MASKDVDFPNLAGTDWEQKSPIDPTYNCLAFAAGRQDRYWWLDEYPDQDSDYWPAGLPREETVEDIVQLYTSLGFELCNNAEHEPGFQKVAIYAKGDEPTHAAAQTENGHWESKLGPEDDIRHATLEALSGPCYGVPVRFLRKARPRSPRRKKKKNVGNK